MHIKISYYEIHVHGYSSHLLRIPNGKRIWFWYETAPAPVDASELKNRKQSKNSAYSQQSGPISHIVCTDFHQCYGFKFKNFKF